MTYSEARDAILLVFKDCWPYHAVYTDVPGSVPSSEILWARATIRHAAGGQATLAGAQNVRRWDRSGTVIIQVFAPVGDGSKAGYEAAQLVVDGFQASNHSNLWFRNVRMCEMGTSGAFEQFNILATFFYDDVR